MTKASKSKTSRTGNGRKMRQPAKRTPGLRHLLGKKKK